MNPDDLPSFKERKRVDFHKRIAVLCEPTVFPKQEIDQVTGTEVTLEGVANLREMFLLFGVTELDPTGDFATVLNTWYQLSGSVASHLRSEFPYDVDNKAMWPTWHPAYVQYVDALIDADTDKIARAAKALGITAGIPPGVFPPLPWTAPKGLSGRTFDTQGGLAVPLRCC